MWTRLYAETYSYIIPVCFFFCSFWKKIPPLSFWFHLFFCHVFHIEMCLKCAVVIQGVPTFSFCSSHSNKSPAWLLPTDVSPLPSRSYHYCKFDLSKVHLPFHFIMARLRVSVSEIARLLLRWKLRLFSALAKGIWRKRRVERWKGWTVGIITQDDDDDCLLCCKCSGRHAFWHIVKEGLKTTLNHNWSIQFPHGLYDVKWRGGWWCRGVTQSQYVHLSMQCY